MIKILENTTLADIVINDMGFTVSASSTYDITSKDAIGLSNSDILLTSISSGDLKLRTGDGSTADYHKISDTIRIIFQVPTSLPLVDDGKKLIAQSTARPIISNGHKFATYWSSYGDDLVNNVLGGGEAMAFDLTVGTPIVTKDFYYSSAFGDIYVHQASIAYDNAGWGDYITAKVMSMPTSMITNASGDFSLDGNRLRYVGAGAGTHDMAASPFLVPRYNSGYWDYSPTAGLTFNPTSTGDYDIYDIEVPVNRFVNGVNITGSSNGYVTIDSDDSSLLPAYCFIRIRVYNVSNTTWRLWGYIKSFREFIS